jgi:hypothetical protein
LPLCRDTITFLRRNPRLHAHEGGAGGVPLGLDLLRVESLNALDAATCARVLRKNYAMLVSMCPFVCDARSVVTTDPPHVGPPIPELTSPWTKLWIYQLVSVWVCWVWVMFSFSCFHFSLSSPHF